MNFQEARIKAEKLNPAQVSKSLFQEIRRIEQFLIDLNIIQIENSRDSFDRTLQNTNRLYSGNYTQTTVDIAAKENPRQPKVLGQPYNFEWEGDFLDKFVLNINNETISLNSKGTGTGGKALFFEGYDFIFGLTDESLKEVVNEKLLPFFLEYFYNELT